MLPLRSHNRVPRAARPRRFRERRLRCRRSHAESAPSRRSIVPVADVAAPSLQLEWPTCWLLSCLPWLRTVCLGSSAWLLRLGAAAGHPPVMGRCWRSAIPQLRSAGVAASCRFARCSEASQGAHSGRRFGMAAAPAAPGPALHAIRSQPRGEEWGAARCRVQPASYPVARVMACSAVAPPRARARPRSRRNSGPGGVRRKRHGGGASVCSPQSVRRPERAGRRQEGKPGQICPGARRDSGSWRTASPAPAHYLSSPRARWGQLGRAPGPRRAAALGCPLSRSLGGHQADFLERVPTCTLQPSSCVRPSCLTAGQPGCASSSPQCSSAIFSLLPRTRHPSCDPGGGRRWLHAMREEPTISSPDAAAPWSTALTPTCARPCAEAPRQDARFRLRRVSSPQHGPDRSPGPLVQARGSSRHRGAQLLGAASSDPAAGEVSHPTSHAARLEPGWARCLRGGPCSSSAGEPVGGVDRTVETDLQLGTRPLAATGGCSPVTWFTPGQSGAISTASADSHGPSAGAIEGTRRNSVPPSRAEPSAFDHCAAREPTGSSDLCAPARAPAVFRRAESAEPRDPATHSGEAPGLVVPALVLPAHGGANLAAGPAAGASTAAFASKRAPRDPVVVRMPVVETEQSAECAAAAACTVPRSRRLLGCSLPDSKSSQADCKGERTLPRRRG